MYNNRLQTTLPSSKGANSPELESVTASKKKKCSFFFDFSTLRRGETSSPRQLGSAMIRRRSLEEELAEVGVDGRGETEVGDEMEHPLDGARERRERGVSE